MPLFEYAGGSVNGRQAGTIEAKSKSIAKELLLKKGINPTDLRKCSVHSEKTFWRFLSFLQILLEQNIPLAEALKLGSKQPNKKLSLIFQKTLSNLEDGYQFHEIIGNIFPGIDKNKIILLRIGVERAGLKKAINGLLEKKKVDDQFSLILQKTLAYPIFVLFFAVTALIVIFDTVLPEFKSLIDLSKASMLQNIIMKASGKGYSSVVSFVWMIAGFVAIVRFLMFSDAVKFKFFQFCDKTPLVNRYLRAKSGQDFLSSLSLSLALHTELMEAVRMAAVSVNNPVHSKLLLQLREKIKLGYSLSGVLSETKLFKELDIAIIKLAEQTQNLAGAMASICDQTNLARIKKLTVLSQVIGPFAILILGLIIFLVAYVVITPMMALQNSIG